MLRPHVPAALLVCLGILLSVVLWSLVGGREEERLRLDLERRTDYIAASIAREMDESIERLESIRAFLDAGPAPDRRRFRLLVRSAFGDDASLLSLKWAPRVMAAERAPFEAEARRGGVPGFRVVEQGAGGGMVPAGPRAEYMPVLFAEPFAGHEDQLGFDLASEPARRVALEQARDTGKPMATGRVRLVLEPGEQWGVLMLMPVYRGVTPGSVEKRREALRGYALGVFRIGDLVGSALKHLGLNEVDLRIEDATAPPGQRILLSRAPWEARPGPPGNGRLPARRMLDVAGRRWALEVRPTPLFLAAHRSRQDWTVLGAGLLTTALLGAYLFTSANRAARLTAVNRELEREVAERQRAEAEGERQRREAEALAEVARAINASLDLRTVLQRVTEAARELCGSDTARLALRDPETGAMPYRYAAGTEYSGSPTEICEPGKGVGGQALATGRPFRTDCYEEDPRITRDYLAAAQAEGIVAVLAVPICGEGQVDGVLLLDNRSPRPFTDGDEALLGRLADHAAVALRNARLYSRSWTSTRWSAAWPAC